MKKRQTSVLLLGGLLLVAAALWITTASRPTYVMPAHGGKTADEWFFGPTGHPGVVKTMEQARLAFAEMGTNCIPFLLDKASTRETVFNRFGCWVHPNLPTWIKRRLKKPAPAADIQMIAYDHLRVRTQESDFMADEILAHARTVTDDWARMLAFNAAMPLAESMRDVEKRKSHFLYFLDDPNFQIQIQSAVGLAYFDNTITNGLPILIRAVTNRSLVAQSITSTYPARVLTRLSPGQMQMTIKSHQELAYGALQIVSPMIADVNKVAE